MQEKARHRNILGSQCGLRYHKVQGQQGCVHVHLRAMGFMCLASCNQPHPGGGFQSSGHSGVQVGQNPVGQNPVEIDFQNSGETTTPEIIFIMLKMSIFIQEKNRFTLLCSTVILEMDLQLFSLVLWSEILAHSRFKPSYLRLCR